MANINYQSDFQVEVGLKGKNIVGIPFTLTFYTATGDATYVCDYDGTTYTNCKRLNDTTILVTFNAHELRPGQLKVKKEFHVSNLTYPDGVQTIVDVEQLDIYLVTGKADTVDPIKATIYQTFLKPVKGIDYFTPDEQLDFKNTIIRILKEDGELRSEVYNELKNDGEFFNNVVRQVEANLKADDAFLNQIMDKVYNSGLKNTIKSEVRDSIVSDNNYLNLVAQAVLDRM